MYDVIIVGAGPSGCRTAELISSQGYRVLLLEEHKEVGKPLHCAGLVSWRLLELVPDLPEEIIVNIVNKAKFFSPSGHYFTLKSKKPVYVIDRIKFDKYLSKRAIHSGVSIKLSTRFESLRYLNNGIKVVTNRGKFKTKLLVGADGANSQVAEQAGIKQPNNVLTGVQTTVKGDFDSDSVELWFGSKVAPDFFAWVIPENGNRARIGLATKANCRYYFEKFLKKRTGKSRHPSIGGNIRFGLIGSGVTDRILLVGGAAAHVKPFSGGGIIYGLIASNYCADACVKALKKNRFDHNFLKQKYDKKWKEKLEKPIKRGLQMKRILYSFSDPKLDLIFSSSKIGLTKILNLFDMDLL